MKRHVRKIYDELKPRQFWKGDRVRVHGTNDKGEVVKTDGVYVHVKWDQGIDRGEIYLWNSLERAEKDSYEEFAKG